MNSPKKYSVVAHSQRLDVFIASQWSSSFSRTQAAKLIQSKKVRVNQKVIHKPSHMLQTADVVELEYVSSPQWSLQANNLNVPVLFQDDYLAVVHKPINMTVHPGAGTNNDTLVHSLLAQIQLSSGSEKDRPGIVHRLDRQTEGLMVVAKTDHAHFKLSELFQKRQIEKRYLAWTCGFPQPEQDNITGYISRHPQQRTLMVFSEHSLHAHSKSASLEFTTIKKKFPFALVSINLLTGRTHQIRASFQYKKIPVVNDPLYGSSHFFERHNFEKSLQKKIENLDFLLAAVSLSFQHPYTGKPMSFSIEHLPRFEKFEQVIKILE